jgi:hypothetical protein
VHYLACAVEFGNEERDRLLDTGEVVIESVAGFDEKRSRDAAEPECRRQFLLERILD